MTPLDSPVDSVLSESANQVFLGFTYVAPSVLESMSRPFRPRSFGGGRSVPRNAGALNMAMSPQGFLVPQFGGGSGGGGGGGNMSGQMGGGGGGGARAVPAANGQMTAVHMRQGASSAMSVVGAQQPSQR